MSISFGITEFTLNHLHRSLINFRFPINIFFFIQFLFLHSIFKIFLIFQKFIKTPLLHIIIRGQLWTMTIPLMTLFILFLLLGDPIFSSFRFPCQIFISSLLHWRDISNWLFLNFPFIFICHKYVHAQLIVVVLTFVYYLAYLWLIESLEI